MNCILNSRDADVGVCLAVVEAGSEPNSRATDDGVVNASARVMVMQQLDETPAEFALRATRRATQLTRNGAPLEAGVIVASDAADDETFLSRCRIARAMIRAMRGAAAPRLIFVASSMISDQARHELFSLAGTLSTQLHGTPIEVSVRFAERRVSGVHPVVRPVAPRIVGANAAPLPPAAEVA